ncbi:tegument protein UL51 [Spheniscid alphaherpesvirus 1]|uniref:Tegument protein UL51 n=1 Tax=Spheniscid alphaherpesvirus 1 TaxID=2560777 RepID=A0A1R3T406_9ALPH|nr:tegument protein UL51 [Spheniscid alphaherpesvirus 1]SCO83496.1 tegument protein UL51 [Spheniscid alphaherpesvirus 1]
MFEFIKNLCSRGNVAGENYERISTGEADQITTFRLREAIASVNALLPAPLTLEDVVVSSDGIRKLARAQTLSRTYQMCQRNLECLANHVSSAENPGLDAVVRTHCENSRRMADTCLATLLHLYLSVGSAENTETIVDQVIRITSENNVVMADVAVVEHALGLKPKATPIKDYHCIEHGKGPSNTPIHNEQVAPAGKKPLMATHCTIDSEKTIGQSSRQQDIKRKSAMKDSSTKLMEAV